MKNLKWKRFADEYLIDMNASRAYVAAGYSSKTPDKNAYKLLEKEEIKAYLEKMQAKTSEKLEIDREWVIKEYMELINSCKVEGTGGEYSITDRNNWNKALQNLSKMLGLNEPDKIAFEGVEFNTILPTKDNKNSK